MTDKRFRSTTGSSTGLSRFHGLDEARVREQLRAMVRACDMLRDAREVDRRKPRTILFVAANPRGSGELRLGEECAEIQRELKMAPYRDDFRFASRWAVSIDELMRHLTEINPAVIHFSGHGGGSAGLILQGDEGRPQPVSARALAMMVGAAASHARLVVLNACFSVAQAEALRATVDCVIGMDGAIGDDAARAFAIRFYGALGNRRSVGNAFAHGVAALAARDLPDELMPRCLTRDGVDAGQLVL
ncbi:MAG TPA: CHAT domain-containing protein [Kofleriaceae bacterium]